MFTNDLSCPTAIATCAACELAIDGPALGEGDGALHVECAIDRVAQDAVLAVGGAILLVLAPLVMIWAA
jgi:hypothetical protein